MAFELSLTRDRAFELLELTVHNGARPIMVIEDPDNIAHEMFVDLIFSDRKDTAVFDYSEFVMDRAFSMDKIKELTSYCFVIIENVKHLYGKSATSKILADFVKCMSDESTAVVFIGKRAMYDMAEFIEQAGEYVNYIIKIDKED